MVQAAAQGKTAVEFNCRSYYGMYDNLPFLAVPIFGGSKLLRPLRTCYSLLFSPFLKPDVVPDSGRQDLAGAAG